MSYVLWKQCCKWRIKGSKVQYDTTKNMEIVAWFDVVIGDQTLDTHMTNGNTHHYTTTAHQISTIIRSKGNHFHKKILLSS